MPSRPDTSDYLALFLNDVPLMDVRAPVEFSKGSFPGAINAPLMNDEERHRVGICYKEKGQDEAIKLGHQLVSGDIKAQRIEAWRRFTAEHPTGYLFCFRGGLRSRLSQQWIREAGIDYPLVSGGYKAMRRFLIDSLEALIESSEFVILSGRTGTGKTRVLQQLTNPVDLEGLANHRGSSFGRQVTPQPSQIDFENRLAVAMLKAHHHIGGPVYLEDESRLVGRCALPQSLRDRMATAPVMVLDQPLDERIRIIREDYVDQMTADYAARDGEEAGWLNFRDYLLSALDRIRKRLGDERHSQLRKLMETALDNQYRTGDVHGHHEWIRALLENYYDPMYDYQLNQKEGRIVVQGGPECIIEWARRK
ncbi:tRNA 2-selenouridine(34) synthase MnmH [Marinobacter sp. ATCH36]|uniref:tRNA 2-selenouridine(34) synthase MnmH n=1 Tax=Marinobacter sp. ATCH36 TaxID=2945106 RepID=UPI0020216B3E|nr:tRNA 2-selenouridine(34) synthase MnmH [Marinobacter sp. ATCH36]MCL7943095.1 tRNA 2-selenouridine(34) synthase MnmH [Marinobacter sp. ATCH36]